MNEKTALFVIPTPIGNLEDITYRAVRILNEVDTILAEDTRTSGVLLKHYNIQKKLKSYHAYNEHQQIPKLIERLKNGEIMALISDAGTPGISDPGYLIVKNCLENQIPIECLPGASAILPALIKSGLPADRFVFEGFLPHKKGRKTRLAILAEEQRTMILYESPYRLIKSLEQLIEYMGPGRKASVSRELTKHYEETRNDTLNNLLGYFSQKKVKGEIVIIIEGKPKNH